MNNILQLSKDRCFGCESCVQSCPQKIISMLRDVEGFYYPSLDENKCTGCGICTKRCPSFNPLSFYTDEKYVFGGHINNAEVLKNSTSGGAFTAILEGWCDDNTYIFGAVAEGLKVRHEGISGLSDISRFQKSKYAQSSMGDSYSSVQKIISEGHKVVFSGTPCQIAGLRSFLNEDPPNLLTIEVICEGIPSELYLELFKKYIDLKYGSPLIGIDYRYKDIRRWDFQVMRLFLENGKVLKKDRWFNPFWYFWLNHLMSRPSCYKCPFTTVSRGADISLGDLWGVHLYCPDLYNKNKGASLIVCNTQKGKKAVENAGKYLVGHMLSFDDALKYQSPMRKCISGNPNRELFLNDLNELDYISLVKKWYRRPSFKLLFSKYVWGNRQKVWMIDLKRKFQ